MDNKTLGILSFIAGGIVGSAVTSIVLTKVLTEKIEKKYADISKEEIDSVKEYYKNKYKVENAESNSEEKEIIQNVEENSVDILKEKVEEFGYDKNKENEEEDENMYVPEIIPPEEMWERDYPTISLTYYEKDGILADDKGRIIANPEELVGADFALHFGEYEDDSVHVKNERLKVYYEILRDLGSYTEDN